MQHYIKPSFAKNTQYATKFFNSEVATMYIDKFILLKFKPTINYYLFFYKDFVYLRNYLISGILLAVWNAMSIKLSIILSILGKIKGIAEKNNAQLY